MRITIETVGGNHIDVVSGPDEAVSQHYIFHSDLPRLLSRAKELGAVKGVPGPVFSVLVSEHLIHVRQ